MKKIILLLITTLLLTACEKDNVETFQVLTKISYKELIDWEAYDIHEVTKDYVLMKFYYNQDGMLTAYDWAIGSVQGKEDEIFLRVNIYYNSDDLIKYIQYVDIDTLYMNFSGFLMNAYYDDNNRFIAFSTIEPTQFLNFDTDGNLTERIEGSRTYLYSYDANNNISTYAEYYQGELHQTTNLEYGDNHNPFYQFASYENLFCFNKCFIDVGISYVINSPNNIIKLENLYRPSSPKLIYNFDYEFDSNGYPTKQTTIHERPDGVILTYITQYEYKTITKPL